MQPVNFNLPVDDLITLGFYFTVIIYIIFSIVFHYHWREYSIDTKVTKTTIFFYFVTTIPLILALGIVTLII